MSLGRVDRRGPGRRAGFTLIEVMVAIAVGTVVLVGARALTEQATASAARLRPVVAAGDRAANAERLLRDAVAMAEVGADSARIFHGDPTEARFSTWCSRPAGWLARCTASLAIHRTDTSAVLVLSYSTGERFELRPLGAGAALCYWVTATGGGTWYNAWGDGRTSPTAIGVADGRDTVVLRIGDGG